MSKPSAIVYVDGFNLDKGQLESWPATQLLMGALDGLAGTDVVVSSDSDLAHPIAVAEERFGVRVGLLFPRDERTKLFERAGVDVSLYLCPAFAARNQLREIVRAGTSAVRRPTSWT